MDLIGHKFSTSLEKYEGGPFLDHMRRECLIFKGTNKETFFKVAASSHIPTPCPYPFLVLLVF
jgi:hypothetical protein